MLVAWLFFCFVLARIVGAPYLVGGDRSPCAEWQTIIEKRPRAHVAFIVKVVYKYQSTAYSGSTAEKTQKRIGKLAIVLMHEVGAVVVVVVEAGICHSSQCIERA